MIKFKKEIAGEFAIPQKSKESFRHIAFSATRNLFPPTTHKWVISFNEISDKYEYIAKYNSKIEL